MTASISQTYSYEFNIDQQSKINEFLTLPSKQIRQYFSIENTTYQKIKRYFSNIKSDNYKTKDKYTIDDCGRMFGIKTTLQSISNKVLAFILNNEAYDIDMKNASFSFVKHIINTNFVDDIDKFKTLIDYANNRDKYLKYGFDKMKWIEILFCKKSKSYINKDKYDKEFNRLILEIDIFKQLVHDNIDDFGIDFKDDKHIGSKVSTIIYHLEHNLLQKVLHVYKQNSITPKFDGVVIDKDLDLDVVLDKCNKLGEEYGVKFINKELSFNIDEELDSIKSPEYEVEENTSFNEGKYLEMKEVFEADYFFVENPLSFGYQYTLTDGTIRTTLYSEAQFKTLVKTFQLEQMTPVGIRKFDFFGYWIQDVNRRSYRQVSWIPDLDYKDPQIFNNFTGFKAKKLNISNEELKTKKSIIKFISHLILLTNEETPAFKYLLKYICHMFQKPTELPQTALLFKSYEGVGKDFLTNFFAKMLGNSLVKKEEDMINVLGNFNISLQNKLVLQINEINGKVGHEKKDCLKNLITAEELNLTAKGKDTIEYPNFLRIFLFTNNLNPISISPDNRRYLCFKTGKPKSKQYYIKLGEMLNDDNSINEIYTFLKNYDIGNFCPHIHRCETSYYKSIQQQNTNPIYEYIYDISCNPKEYNIISHKDVQIITSYDFETNYKIWLMENDYNNIIPNSKTNKCLLADLGCKAKRVYLNKEQTRVIELDIEFLKNEMVSQFKVQKTSNLEIITIDKTI